MVNNGLVAVKRQDKTGKLVTRHVRASSLGGNGASLPAPALSSQSKKPVRKKPEDAAFARRVAALEKPRKNTFSPRKLSIAPTERYEKYRSDNYKVECSDNDFYGVLERFTVDDTIMLTARGLTPAVIYKAIADGKSIDRTQDNTELVKELRTRAIPVSVFVASYYEDPYYWDHEPERLLDAAECSASMQRSEWREQFTSMVRYEQISFDDLKTVGTHNVESNYHALFEALNLLKKGDSSCSAQEIRDILDLPDSTRTRTAVRIRLATRYGAEFSGSIKYPNMAMYTEDAAVEMEPDAAMSFLRYADDTFSQEPESAWDVSGVSGDDYLALWQAGVPMEVARDGLDEGLTALEIIAIHEHDIAPSVAEGWL